MTFFSGQLFPLYIKNDKPDAILTIAAPINKILLNFNHTKIFEVSIETMKKYLVKKRYAVQIKDASLFFSRQEILCFISLLKGKKAGEIALELNLKQNTVEAYIKSLKNKCGTNLKSELINFFISNKILEQIII